MAAPSWQDYIDDQLMVELPGGKTLTSAAIIGQDGGVWAKSADFPEVSPEELDAITAGFSDTSSLEEKGIVLGGVKYFTIQGEAGSVIRGKKAECGLTIKKTSKAMVVGIYGAGVTPEECNVVVENLADYLTEQDY